MCQKGYGWMIRNTCADEGMDIKKYMLCLLSRLPALLGAVIGGALLGAVIYTIVRTVPESEREYQAYAKIQLDFAADETGEVYQAYNGYTWNDLMAADPIMNLTMGNLSPDYDREEVAASLRAEILSDIRILTLTVTTNSAACTDEILGAAVQALESYGTQAKEFLEINAIQTTQAKLVVADSRMAQAVLVGAALGLLISLLGISLYYVMDDRIRVLGDIKSALDIPFIGYRFDEEGPAALRQDYERNLSFFREKYGELFIWEVRGEENPTEEKLQEMRKAGCVILSLPFGAVPAAYALYVREMLKNQQCRLRGVEIRQPDLKFLRRYYGSFAFGSEKEGKKV